MSWMQKLYETYEACAANPAYVDPPQPVEGPEVPALMPVCHTSQQAHIRVTLDAGGNFIRAELLPPKSQFVVPATEDSASRSGPEPPPHPLCDKIQYCARDYSSDKGKTFHEDYVKLLKDWCNSKEYSHPMAEAVLAYVTGHDLIKDLEEQGVLEQFRAAKSKYPQIKDVGGLVIVWSVLLPDKMEHNADKDKELQQAWITYDTARMQQKGFCMVKGEEAPLTDKHPRNIRRSGDGAKLISSNDKTNFTFRGRFLKPEQACSVGYEVSQKAHNALRWLIQRQGYRSGEQAVVAWAVCGAPLPNPCEEDPFNLSEEDFTNAPASGTETAEPSGEEEHRDVGQAFSERLKKALKGYRAKLNDTDGISIMAMDAASPGRLSVTFYREQMFGEYLNRLQAWQEDCAWMLPVRRKDGSKSSKKQDKKTSWQPYAPTPGAIARAAYGSRLDEKLQKATVERLLPCIVDGAPLPRDLVESCVRRACSRAALEPWEWREVLAVACALYKGWRLRKSNYKEKRFEMSLDESIASRDYLYGRLLAVAEYIERTALDAAGEDRPTNAERLMQRFADRPFETWRQIELHLSPYMQRLQNSAKAGFLIYAKREMQKIYDMMAPEDFASKAKLSGEFLLGYHCQRSAFYRAKDNSGTIEADA